MLLTATSTAAEIVETIWSIYDHEQAAGRWLVPLTRLQFLRAALPVAIEYHEGMFDGLTRGSTTIFFRRLQTAIPRFPWGWLELFEASYKGRAMNPVCWGAAARAICVAATPPEGAKYEDHLALLPSLRAAAPEGLMGTAELGQLRASSSAVHAYRCAPAGMHFEAAMGYDWCFTIKRAAARAYNLHTLDGILPIAPQRPGARLTLVKATIPIEAVLAAFHESEDEPCDLLADFLKIDLATVKKLNLPNEMDIVIDDILLAAPLMARRMIEQSRSGAQF